MIIMILILPFSLIVMKTALAIIIVDEMYISIVLDCHLVLVSYSVHEFLFILRDFYF